jgi:hypothetical protein
VFGVLVRCSVPDFGGRAPMSADVERLSADLDRLRELAAAKQAEASSWRPPLALV